MIIRIQKAGHSFKALGAYLTEDKSRVAWTHSFNCANDHVPYAIHEMVTTYREAEVLKELAGAHGGGTALENPVKHISLNWHPDQKVSKEEMIAAAESFLQHMGWDEHQALLVSHNDRPHPHVHIEINRVHPLTGLGLDDGNERIRASDWRRSYEREHGQIFTREQPFDYAERSPSPTRETWTKLKEAEERYDRNLRAEYERLDGFFAGPDREKGAAANEWEILKRQQREEREAHFAENKKIFKAARNEVYQDIRESFRQDWADYYAAVRAGIPIEMQDKWHAALIDGQRAAFEDRKNAVFDTIKAQREQEYKEILQDQKAERGALHIAQGDDRRSYHLLNSEYPTERSMAAPAAANENTAQDGVGDERSGREENKRDDDVAEANTHDGNDPRAHPVGGLADLGGGLIGGLATVVERLMDGFLGGPSPVRESPKPEPAPDTRQQRTALRAQRIEESIRAFEEERERKRDDHYWEERRNNRR